MTNQQENIELEMRLSALEYMICKLYATGLVSSGLSDEQIKTAHQKFSDGAKQQTFPDLAPAMSDLVSGEWEQAVGRLLNAQREMVAQLMAKTEDG